MGDETTQSEKKGRKIRRLLKIFSLITSSVLFVFLLVIIFLNLYGVIPKISSEVIVIILVLTIITFSGSFTSFSIGNIFSMSRELKSAKDEIARLSNYNIALQKTVVSANQNISINNVSGIGITTADEKEIQKKEAEENSEENSETTSKQTKKKNLPNHKEFVDFVENQIEKIYNFEKINRNIAIQAKEASDAISGKSCIYDLHIRDRNYFVEVKGPVQYSTYLFNNLYLMLNKIFLFNKANNSNSHLELIFVYTNDEERDEIESMIKEIEKDFKNAKDAGLLRVEKYDYRKK